MLCYINLSVIQYPLRFIADTIITNQTRYTSDFIRNYMYAAYIIINIRQKNAESDAKVMQK